MLCHIYRCFDKVATCCACVSIHYCNSGLLFVLHWRPGIDLAPQDSVTLFFIRSSTVVLELHNSPEEEQG